jgi:hypothetical protein
MSKQTPNIHSWAIAIFMLAAAALGCGTNDVTIHDWPTATGGGGGAGGGTTGTGGAGGEGCEGQCVPFGPGVWSTPLLVWMGKDGDAPDCPASAPIADAPMFADLNAPTVCGACTCDAPTGTCALPTTLTAASAPCPGNAPGIAHTSFNAPAAWDGSCTAVSPIAANLPCGVGNCVQSLTIEPLTLTENACAVKVEPVAAKVPYTWGTTARSCRGAAYGRCSAPADGCAPAAEPGFAQCIGRDGDRECPGPYYTVKHVFYSGLADTRDCTACACGAPAGSTCTAFISAFKDGSCSSPVVAGTVDATGSACLDVLPSGQALGSKLATAPVYAPGACQVSGGEPTGEALPVQPSTYCCLP